METKKRSVLIIGAGPAGLTAAYELLKRGFAVTVLERSDAIGGISRTVRHAGCRMDIGGHRFFSKDARVTAWWHQFLPLQGYPSMDDKLLDRPVRLAPNGPDPERQDRVMLSRTRVSRIYYRGRFFDYPIRLKWETFKSMGLRITAEVGISYLASVLHRLPEDNLENYYINCFGKKLYRMFFEGYTEKLWGRHPREIDASWGKQRTKELSVAGVVRDMLSKVFSSSEKRAQDVQTSLIEAFEYPKLGPGQLWECVADEVRTLGGTIVTDCCVHDIVVKENAVKAVRCDGREGKRDYCADAFFSSMPLKDLLAGIKHVPENVRQAGIGLPYRDFVTVGLLVDRINLKNETKQKALGDLVPDCWIYVQEPNVKLGRIQIFNNWSPYLVEDPEHSVWLGLEYFCREGDDFWNMTDTECAAFVAGELCQLGILDDPKRIRTSHRERVVKAYPAYFDTYRDIGVITEYLDAIGNLYCIGRNGQHRYNNMDHSMATAFEAVEIFCAGKTERANLWSVNTEKSYHEEKR